MKSALLLADLERPLTSNTGKANVDTEMLPTKSKSSSKLNKVQTDVPAHPIKGHISKSKSMGGGQAIAGASSSSNHALGTDWLLSTASILAMTTAESKGQSWLATKSASTSLVGTPYVEKDEFVFRSNSRTHDGHDLLDSPPTSKTGTRRNSISTSVATREKSRGGSRPDSRAASRIGSRINLTALHSRQYLGDAEHRTDDFSNMGVDFADQGIGDEQDDSDSELDEYEEGELKKLVWGRVGGWVDWAVGWMDWRDGLQGVDDEEDLQNIEQEKTLSQRSVKQRKRRRATLRSTSEQSEAGSASSNVDPISIPAAPEETGVVGDARWLLGMAGKLII